MDTDEQELNREILLAFWKVRILNRASKGPIVGSRLLREIGHHGYDMSQGTLYPILERFEKHGWLRCTVDGTGLRARKLYRLTAAGAHVLKIIREDLSELRRELDANCLSPVNVLERPVVEPKRLRHATKITCARAKSKGVR